MPQDITIPNSSIVFARSHIQAWLFNRSTEQITYTALSVMTCGMWSACSKDNGMCCSSYDDLQDNENGKALKNALLNEIERHQITDEQIEILQTESLEEQFSVGKKQVETLIIILNNYIELFKQHQSMSVYRKACHSCLDTLKMQLAISQLTFELKQRFPTALETTKQQEAEQIKHEEAEQKANSTLVAGNV